jgi:hypothetical protein
MSFTYGKLRQQNAPVNPEDLFETMKKRAKVAGRILMIAFGLCCAGILSLVLSADTAMLTYSPSFFDDDTYGWLFWGVGALVGLSVGWYYMQTFGAGAIMGFGLTLALYLFLAPATFMYDTYQEYKLFRDGKSAVSIEQFRVTNVDTGRRSKFAIVEKTDYREKARILAELSTYDFLRANRTELPQKDWRELYDTGHCVNLRVEHNGKAARIRVDGKITMAQLIKCPLPSSGDAGTDAHP